MSYPVGPCVWWGGMLLLVWAVAAAVVAWAVIREGLAPGAMLLPVLAALPALVAWRRTPRGRLCWDGAQAWSWQSATASSELPAPQLVWRGQTLLLLRLPGAPRPLGWLWLERARDPGRWDAVCRAAHAA